MKEEDYKYATAETGIFTGKNRERASTSRSCLPGSTTHRPAFPDYFAEEKGPDGNAAELERQITCDLAYGARGMLKMQSYGQGGGTFDGNAYTLGSTYHSGSGVLTM